MTTTLRSLFLLALTITLQPATAAEISGVSIPESITIPDTDRTLVLNGAGIRSKFFMDIYIGALYLPARTSDSDAILGDQGDATVLMHFLYKEVDRDKLVEGWNDGFRANLDAADLQSLHPRLAQFNELFTTVRNGDLIRIDYRPGSGTEVRINDSVRGTVEGNDFFRALLRVWLGPEPVSKRLKEAMLGGN